MEGVPPALLSLADYLALAAEARLALAPGIAGRLGPGWEAKGELVGAKGLIGLRHAPTDVDFAVIPGGTFQMGLRDDDLEELGRYLDWQKAVPGMIKGLQSHASPLHEVRVEPFLCARAPLTTDQVKAIGQGSHKADTFRAEKARTFVAEAGFRLPSEAELEWLAREGGELHFTCNLGVESGLPDSDGYVDTWQMENGFGIADLLAGEWAADDWHKDYSGAPNTASPWGGGEPIGVFRGALPSGLEEPRAIVFALAAFRAPGARPDDPAADERFLMARLARSL